MVCCNKEKLSRLGLHRGDLLEIALDLTCANAADANVLGVFFGRVTGKYGDRKARVARVIVYVLEERGNLLSREVLIKLEVIKSDFPKIGQFDARDLEIGIKIDGVAGKIVVKQPFGLCDSESTYLQLTCFSTKNYDR